MQKFDDKLGADYERRIALAMMNLVRRESLRSDGLRAINVGRAIDGMVLGLALVVAQAGEASTPRDRKGLAGYAHKKLLESLEIADAAIDISGFPKNGEPDSIN